MPIVKSISFLTVITLQVAQVTVLCGYLEPKFNKISRSYPTRRTRQTFGHSIECTEGGHNCLTHCFSLCQGLYGPNCEGFALHLRECTCFQKQFRDKLVFEEVPSTGDKEYYEAEWFCRNGGCPEEAALLAENEARARARGITRPQSTTTTSTTTSLSKRCGS